MRERAFIHVAGPDGAGKTAFIEALLAADFGIVGCVRCRQDASLREERISGSMRDPELRRYAEAGASRAALYRFPEEDAEGFWDTDFMEDYLPVVLLEGENPLGYADLQVFVGPPLGQGESILRRVEVDQAAIRAAELERLQEATETQEGFKRLFLGLLGDASLVEMMLTGSKQVEEYRRDFQQNLDRLRQQPPPPPTEHWALQPGYEDMAGAGLILINGRSEEAKARGEALVAELPRLRKDEDVFNDVIRLKGDRRPVTAVVADLSDPKDAGLKKAIARVRRTVRRMVSDGG